MFFLCRPIKRNQHLFPVDEFTEIEREFPNFKFNLALDRPDPEADAAGVKYTAGFAESHPRHRGKQRAAQEAAHQGSLAG